MFVSRWRPNCQVVWLGRDQQREKHKQKQRVSAFWATTSASGHQKPYAKCLEWAPMHLGVFNFRRSWRQEPRHRHQKKPKGGAPRFSHVSRFLRLDFEENDKNILNGLVPAPSAVHRQQRASGTPVSTLRHSRWSSGLLLGDALTGNKSISAKMRSEWDAKPARAPPEIGALRVAACTSLRDECLVGLDFLCVN